MHCFCLLRVLVVSVFISDPPSLPLKVFDDQHLNAQLSKLTDSVFTCQFDASIGLGPGLPDPTACVVHESPIKAELNKSLEGMYTFRTSSFGRMDLAHLQLLEGYLAAAEWDLKPVGVVFNLFVTFPDYLWL